MAVGKNKRTSKGGGRRGTKKKVIEPMSRKEWYDVVAPENFANRQFAKTLCNKTMGTKIAADNLHGRVFEARLGDLENGGNKDQPFRKVRFCAEEVQGRNVLTRFHGMDLTADKYRSLVRKWCTTIEHVVEVKTTDGFTLRLFLLAFTARQSNQLSKNCNANTRLIKWVRHRMGKMVQSRLSKCDLNHAVTLLTQDILSDAIHKRCNPIVPLRDVKIRKVKLIRTPRFDPQRLADAHGTVPTSMEAEARIVQVAAEPEKKDEKAAEKKDEKPVEKPAEKPKEDKPAEKPKA